MSRATLGSHGEFSLPYITDELSTPRPMNDATITRSQIVAQLRTLGVEPGDILEVHSSLRSIGSVVGGADAVVLALLDAVVPGGTIVAFVSMHDNSYHLHEWSEDRQQAYRSDLPGFDVGRSSARSDHGFLAERIRTWPGALRSVHPEAGVAAVGDSAALIVDPHPDDFAFGRGTPFDRIKAAGGKVLMLGAPLGTITMLHHAETIAEVPDKRLVNCELPVEINGQAIWQMYRDIDSSSRGAFQYSKVLPEGQDPFEFIALEAMRFGIGQKGKVGLADSYLFPAKALVDFAVTWIQGHFHGT